jgi:hypothetical protein
MYMKKLLIVAVASLIGSAAFAQSTTTGGIRYGLKAGVNLPKYHIESSGGTSETNSATNFHITGFMESPIGAGFAIQPGISLQGKGGETTSGSTNVKQNTLWLEVPVNLVANIPTGQSVGLFLGAGPYAAFGISGKTKTTIGNVKTESDVDFGDSSGDDLKGTDFGMNFIGGLRMTNGFTLGAGYGLGFTDLRPNASGNGKLTNRVLSFSVGINL